MDGRPSEYPLTERERRSVCDRAILASIPFEHAVEKIIDLDGDVEGKVHDFAVVPGERPTLDVILFQVGFIDEFPRILEADVIA